LLSIIKIFL
jgi:hypothetical protein